MKLSYNWLCEWVNPQVSAADLAARITLAGLESEAEPMSGEIPRGVVVGRIVKAERHPQADRLQVCEVDAGNGPLQIVCGAANARAGLNVPCATVGARLPGGTEIGQAKLRGVDSFGMLCSAKELGLAEKSEGLLELDDDAIAGTPIEQYLSFTDDILNLELTPNRGDCLSVLGLAREVSALYGLQMKRPNIPNAVVVGHAQYKVEIEDAANCPSYAGRVISGINPKARTPDWMRERLRRSGIRCIHPVVDITNFVMLELGQPLHAFDCERIGSTVRVRKARAGETLKLLNEQIVTLDHGELVIADEGKLLALAGVMGGAESGVVETTTRIFLESACFAPHAVALTGRRHKLHSDALHRFERGVDPGLQRTALERTTQLILQICGGGSQPGIHAGSQHSGVLPIEVHPVTQVGRSQPDPVNIRLRHARLKQLLGVSIEAKEMEALLARLGITLRPEINNSWQARIPSHRTDLRIEADLIEEVARLYGYERIVAKPYAAQLAPAAAPEALRPISRIKDLLVGRGWQEAITLSFVDARIQMALTPDTTAVALDNPIAETLSVMRATLWSGLIPAWLHNHQRQQRRVRLFEHGVCFAERDGQIIETVRIGGLASGSAFPEQWGSPARPIDFHDLKADVVALLGSAADEYTFVPDSHPALHPGRSARILRKGQVAGWIGTLHPQVVATLQLPDSACVFELDWMAIRETGRPAARPLSEFPSSRRDLAVIAAETVTAQQIVDCVQQAGGKSLQKVLVFDIYRGKGLGDACKSVALGLIFNDYSRTLTVEEIDSAVAAITTALAQQLGASI
ncbi:MAG TPA: phenylalanine--tRNA ligase subunit beta, partial [Stenotrophobium sp.]|nr:phenylalanine--tRNA ligase subunit beta [Stenotrophobium sp.]